MQKHNLAAFYEVSVLSQRSNQNKMIQRDGFQVLNDTHAEYKGIEIKCEANWVKTFWGKLEAEKSYLALGKRFESLIQVFDAIDKTLEN